jgi:hypothetical protein
LARASRFANGSGESAPDRRLLFRRGMNNQVAFASLLLAGCFQAPVETPQVQVHQVSDTPLETVTKNQVDLLFMIDNSPSMSPKQQELKARFPELIKILDDFGKTTPAHYHIGVVTSDLGAGAFNLGGGQCHPGGDGGKLQALGANHDASCLAPTGGINFIDYDQTTGMNNLPGGQDLATTFSCMASVGDKGCGFEQQLEAVYRALHDSPAENHDFLRANALLVVVWVTDEDDDCSIDPASDLFDPAQTANYGALLSYRGTQYGVMCPQGGSLQLMPYGPTGGDLEPGCVPAPNTSGNVIGMPTSGQGKCFDVSRYIDFLTKPASQGGVKKNANDVILVAIDGPNDHVESILGNPNPQPPGPYVQCPGPVDGKTCAVLLQHSCIAPDNTQFYGDPAVRINSVVGAAANHQLTSICDTSYQAALQSLGGIIVEHIGGGCITSPIEDPEHPDCTVQGEGLDSTVFIPSCSQSAPPCWKLQPKPVCDPSTGGPAGCCPTSCIHDGDPAQHFGMTVDWGGKDPPDLTLDVQCASLAVPGHTPVCGPPL